MAKKIIVYVVLFVMLFSVCGCTSGGKVFIKNYFGYYGLCDEDGDYIIKPKYHQMIGLDNDEYLVCLPGSEAIKICTVVGSNIDKSEFVTEYSKVYTVVNRKDKVLRELEDVEYAEEIADGIIVMLKKIVRDTTPRGPENIITYGYVGAECYIYDSALNPLNSEPWYNVKKYGEDKLLLTDEDGTIYLTDYSLNYISTKGYDEIYYINDELCGIVEKSKHGIMNMDGEVVVSPEYTEATMAVDEGLLAVGKDGKYSLMSSQTFNITGEISFSQIESFGYYGVARVVLEDNGKIYYAFVNDKGEAVVDFGTYSYISQFSGGKAVACVGGYSENSFRHTDSKMEFDAYPDMSFTYPETDNFAEHRNLDRQPAEASWVLIDTQGNVIREATNEDIAQYDVR
ncbi:MAG: WG repeat-containing protein [Clostridiales bacterium]|nr:WG repeat-containing protein [Clostridiales bacterium]